MKEGPCLVCGASWECDHRADPERRRLRYVRPDGQTLGEYQRERFHQATALIGAACGTVRALGKSVGAATESIQQFTAWWDALPEATKEEVRRLDASP